MFTGINFDCKTKFLDIVENLTHLRYLNLFHYDNVLPETICNLCNLQILKFTQTVDSMFTKLLQGIGKLINLTNFIYKPMLNPMFKLFILLL